MRTILLAVNIMQPKMQGLILSKKIFLHKKFGQSHKEFSILQLLPKFFISPKYTNLNNSYTDLRGNKAYLPSVWYYMNSASLEIQNTYLSNMHRYARTPSVLKGTLAQTPVNRAPKPTLIMSCLQSYTGCSKTHHNLRMSGQNTYNISFH